MKLGAGARGCGNAGSEWAMKLEVKDGGVVLMVKVVPNSSRSGFAGVLGDALKIKVAQPPEGGKANRAVEAMIAQALALPLSKVRVVGGHASARKVIYITGMGLEAIRAGLRKV